MNIKAIIIPFVGAALLAGAALVGAQDDTNPAQPPVVEQDGDRPGLRDRFQRASAPFDGEMAALIQEYTGLAGPELLREIRNNDGTLADLITANGGDVDAFISEAVALVEARIDEAVANGNIDADIAEDIKVNATDRVTELVNSEWEPRRQGGEGRFAGEFEAIALAEEFTGLEPQAIREAVQGGATLAELIEANGSDVDAFVTEAVALVEAHLDEAVANGNMDADRAEQLKGELTERITARINGERPQRPASAD